MMLSPNEHAYIAQRGQWYFDVKTAPRNTTALPDNCVFTGQGLSDLNRTIGFINFNPGVHVICEVGTGGTVLAGNAFPKYLPADVEDIYAIKEQFIAYYGSVERPNAYVSPPGAAMKVEVFL